MDFSDPSTMAIGGFLISVLILLVFIQPTLLLPYVDRDVIPLGRNKGNTRL